MWAVNQNADLVLSRCRIIHFNLCFRAGDDGVTNNNEDDKEVKLGKCVYI